MKGARRALRTEEQGEEDGRSSEKVAVAGVGEQLRGGEKAGGKAGEQGEG